MNKWCCSCLGGSTSYIVTALACCKGSLTSLTLAEDIWGLGALESIALVRNMIRKWNGSRTKPLSTRQDIRPVAALYRRGTACLSCTERSMSTCPLACADMIIIWLLLPLYILNVGTCHPKILDDYQWWMKASNSSAIARNARVVKLQEFFYPSLYIHIALVFETQHFVVEQMGLLVKPVGLQWVIENVAATKPTLTTGLGTKFLLDMTPLGNEVRSQSGVRQEVD